MPLFTFYPCRSDGSSTSIETFVEAHDTAALARAEHVLREHPSAVQVVVWQGERRIGAVARVAHHA
jgi:hypothetical protein